MSLNWAQKHLPVSLAQLSLASTLFFTEPVAAEQVLHKQRTPFAERVKSERELREQVILKEALKKLAELEAGKPFTEIIKKYGIRFSFVENDPNNHLAWVSKGTRQVKINSEHISAAWKELQEYALSDAERDNIVALNLVGILAHEISHVDSDWSYKRAHNKNIYNCHEEELIAFTRSAPVVLELWQKNPRVFETYRAGAFTEFTFPLLLSWLDGPKSLSQWTTRTHHLFSLCSNDFDGFLAYLDEREVVARKTLSAPRLAPNSKDSITSSQGQKEILERADSWLSWAKSWRELFGDQSGRKIYATASDFYSRRLSEIRCEQEHLIGNSALRKLVEDGASRWRSLATFERELKLTEEFSRQDVWQDSILWSRVKVLVHYLNNQQEVDAALKVRVSKLCLALRGKLAEMYSDSASLPHADPVEWLGCYSLLSKHLNQAQGRESEKALIHAQAEALNRAQQDLARGNLEESLMSLLDLSQCAKDWQLNFSNADYLQSGLRILPDQEILIVHPWLAERCKVTPGTKISSHAALKQALR